MSSRQSKACETCHLRKVRCDLETKGVPCSKCQAAGDTCVPHQRKRKRGNRPRSPSPTVSRQTSAATVPDISVSDSAGDQSGRESPGGTTGYLGAERYFQHAPVWLPSSSSPRLNPLSASSPDPSPAVLHAALQNFAERILPWFPIVTSAEIEKAQTDDSCRILRYALAAAGCAVSRAPRCRKETLNYYQKGKLMLNGNQDGTIDPAIRIKSASLLSIAAPSPPQWVSLDSNYHWMSIAASLAFQCGLNQEKSPKFTSSSEHRRIWHCLRTRDNFLSATQGRPRVINREDSHVPPLRREDVDDAQTNPELFLAYFYLGEIFSDLATQLLRNTLTQESCTGIENNLVGWISNLPDDLQLFENGSVKAYDFSRTVLHISYFACVIVFSRGKFGSLLNMQAFAAASCISGLLESLLAQGDVDVLLPNATFALLAAGLVQLGSRSIPEVWTVLRADFDIVIEALREKAKGHLTAKGGLESVLRASSAHSGPDTIPDSIFDKERISSMKLFSTHGPEICRIWKSEQNKYRWKQSELSCSERNVEEAIDQLGSIANAHPSSTPVDEQGWPSSLLAPFTVNETSNQQADLAWNGTSDAFGFFEQDYGLPIYLFSDDQMLI